MNLDNNTKILINGIEIPSENFQDTDIEFFIGDKDELYNEYNLKLVAEVGSEADINLRRLVNKIGK